MNMKIKHLVQKPAKGIFRKRRGFTIIEIVVVLAIIGIILTIAVQSLSPARGFAYETQARSEINTIDSALLMYKSRSGMYPTQAQGIKALVEKPTTAPVPSSWMKNESVPLIDPWGNEYVYKYPGTKNKSKPDIISKGVDHELGTDDDISN